MGDILLVVACYSIQLLHTVLYAYNKMYVLPESRFVKPIGGSSYIRRASFCIIAVVVQSYPVNLLPANTLRVAHFFSDQRTHQPVPGRERRHTS
jgi:hypothetical protein